MSFKPAGWVGALSLAAANACAQETLPHRPPLMLSALDPVVVSATRFEQSLTDVIPSVTHISREEIDQSGAKSLAELIYTEPGVEVGRNGGLGTVTSFFLRGNESRNVLILLDGQRLRDGIAQSSLAEHIPLGLIESVEIIRGNVSALYGDGAVGGVVSITTRMTSDKPLYFGSASVGSRNTQDMFAGFSGGYENFRVTVGAQYLSTDGFSATNPAQTGSSDNTDGDRDRYESHSINLRVQDRRGDLFFGAALIASDSTTAFDNEYNQTNPVQKARLWTTSGFLNYQLTRNFQTRLELGKSEIDLRYNFGTRNTTDSTQTRWENKILLSRDQQIVLGVEHRDDHRTPADNGLSSRTIDSTFLGYLGTLGLWSTQINLRNDESSTGEEKGTWLAGVGRQISDHLRLTASKSTAFRLPTAYEISETPSLKPEFHQSSEFGLQYSATNIFTRLVFFRGTTSNPITYGGSNGWGKPINSNFRENQGMEIDSRWRDGRHSVKTALTIQDPKSPLNGSSVQPVQVQSARRAKVFGNVDYSYSIDDLSYGVEFVGASKRRDTDSDTEGEYKLGGYGLINLKIQKKLERHWTLFARVDNVFDKHYQLASGYNTPPLGIFGGVRYSN